MQAFDTIDVQANQPRLQQSSLPSGRSTTPQPRDDDNDEILFEIDPEYTRNNKYYDDPVTAAYLQTFFQSLCPSTRIPPLPAPSSPSEDFPHPNPFSRVSRSRLYNPSIIPTAPFSDYDPNDPSVVEEQLALQMQMYALSNNATMSDSTFSLSSTPFPRAGYNPWVFLPAMRAFGGRRFDSMSLQSSPSHQPISLPHSTHTRGRGLKKREKSSNFKTSTVVKHGHQKVVSPPPRVESTQPRDTSPEPYSSGEEDVGEEDAHKKVAWVNGNGVFMSLSTPARSQSQNQASSPKHQNVRPPPPLPSSPSEDFPHPNPFSRVSRSRLYNPNAIPTAPFSNYDPNHPLVVEEQLALQMQMYALSNNATMSDSTFSLSSTPFPRASYNPWVFLQATRAFGGRRSDPMSLQSSPSHQPVSLPYSTYTSGRGLKRCEKSSKLKTSMVVKHDHQKVVSPPPRVESTQPRDTSPEPYSSGEEDAWVNGNRVPVSLSAPARSQNQNQASSPKHQNVRPPPPPPSSPLVDSSHLYPFMHVPRNPLYNPNAIPTASSSNCDPDHPSVIEEQPPLQMQMYTLKNSLPMPDFTHLQLDRPKNPTPPEYDPWAFWQTSRALEGRRFNSPQSSPSHEPVSLPYTPRGRGLKRRESSSNQKLGTMAKERVARPQPRAESTQPRDTSPEPYSSGEEVFGEEGVEEGTHEEVAWPNHSALPLQTAKETSHITHHYSPTVLSKMPQIGASQTKLTLPSSRSSHQYDKIDLRSFPPPPDLTHGIVKLDAHVAATGGFGDVHKCIYDSPSGAMEVAVKAFRFIFTIDDAGTKYAKMIRRELGIWKRLDHPHIVPFLGTAAGFGLKGSTSIVSVWMPNGSLHKFLQNNDATLSIRHRLQLLSDVANGLDYLHSFPDSPIIHGDLNGNNVLVDANFTARLTDFGLSSFVGIIPQGLTYLAGSTARPGALRWAAPEQLGEAYEKTLKSDIYSFGCIGLEVLSGKVPWSELSYEGAIVANLLRGRTPKRPLSREIEDHHWDFIQNCWSPVEERPSAEMLISSLRELLNSCPQSPIFRGLIHSP